MKKIYFKIGLCLVLSLGIGNSITFASTWNDSTEIIKLNEGVKQLNKKINETLQPNSKDTTQCCQGSVYQNIPSKGERSLVSMLIISPIILVVIALIWLITSIRKNKDLFSSLFIEKNAETTKAYREMIAAKALVKKDAAGAVDDANPTTPPNSSSRVIMFLSGIVALLLASVIVSFYIYYCLRCNQEPNLDKLLYVLLALGVGVIPYAVNKVKG